MAARWNGCGLFAAISLAVLSAHTSSTILDPVALRHPRGIYAVVAETRATRAVDLNALLDNPAVSGLAIRTFWSALQPAKDRDDFSSIDAAFAAAAAKHKTVQLILVPGFGTPSWVFDELTSCDDAPTQESATTPGRRGGRAESRRGGAARGGATSGVPATGGSATCGKAMFENAEGRGARAEQQALPMPWNPVYKNYWKAFLAKVAARYQTNEAFVSIAVAGPTAESVEIILPRAGAELERWASLLQGAYRDASYHRSDKAFVEEWDAAVKMYGEVFSNVTLVVTRGSGLPSFTHGQGEAAHEEILSSFARRAVGSNGKATQTSGLKACRETEGGIRGVKEMAVNGSLSPRVLGGAQFDTSFSQKPATEGCAASCEAASAACRSLTPQDALANVLKVYFDGTPAGGEFGASVGKAPMSYLQIYAPDIMFAATDPRTQALLEQASRRLLAQSR